MIGLIRRAAYRAPCTVSIEQNDAHFHAHVELDGDVEIGPGDRVRIDGAPISVPFGASATFARTAIVEPAGPLLRAWTRLAGHFDIAELYEVSFTHRRFS